MKKPVQLSISQAYLTMIVISRGAPVNLPWSYSSLKHRWETPLNPSQTLGTRGVQGSQAGSAVIGQSTGLPGVGAALCQRGLWGGALPHGALTFILGEGRVKHSPFTPQGCLVCFKWPRCRVNRLTGSPKGIFLGCPWLSKPQLRRDPKPADHFPATSSQMEARG